jgi:arsenate reductase
MAESFLITLAGDMFEAESAGLEAGKLNPLVVEAMNEVGIDISNNQTKSVFDFFKQGRMFHFVITVCDAAAAERCPIFAGVTKRLGWSFKDPSKFTGTHDEKLQQIRLVRDSIKAEVDEFIKTHYQYTF